jgi:pilus assembly protein Flp/PilA
VFSKRFEDREERGATAVEYGLLVGLIAIVMITGVALVGPKLSTMFTTVAGKL